MYLIVEVNVRENRRGNQEWIIQRHWQNGTQKTQDEDKQNNKTRHNTEN
jgi:pantothenate kinase